MAHDFALDRIELRHIGERRDRNLELVHFSETRRARHHRQRELRRRSSAVVASERAFIQCREDQSNAPAAFWERTLDQGSTHASGLLPRQDEKLGELEQIAARERARVADHLPIGGRLGHPPLGAVLREIGVQGLEVRP
jgi:hypothetical protein